MEVEAKLQQYLLLSKSSKGAAAADMISKATAEPHLFAYGELLDMPNIKDLQAGDYAAQFALLQLFAYGTCSDYKGRAAQLPPLSHLQQLKLKQLTLISMASVNKVLSYAELQQELDIATVRELEDFIIKDCFYANIIKGKLDQKQSALQVHSAIGRDVNPAELANLAAGLASWTSASDALLRAIEARITYACSAVDAAKAHREAVEAKADEVRRNIKAEVDIRGGGSGGAADSMLLDDEMLDEDRLMQQERIDRPATRPKSRRR